MHSIRYSPEFDEKYIKLKAKAARGNGEANYLLKIISKATAKLLKDKEAGRKIPRKLWPEEYVSKYGITNLWKYNLDSYWRLIYTITGNNIEFFVIYLEYLDHKAYDKKFGYKTS